MILEYHRDVRRLPALLLCQAFFAPEPKEGMRIGHSHVVFSFCVILISLVKHDVEGLLVMNRSRVISEGIAFEAKTLGRAGGLSRSGSRYEENLGTDTVDAFEGVHALTTGRPPTLRRIETPLVPIIGWPHRSAIVAAYNVRSLPSLYPQLFFLLLVLMSYQKLSSALNGDLQKGGPRRPPGASPVSLSQEPDALRA
jgi:hypothetical protein